MGASEGFAFGDLSRLTDGQITWAFLNVEIDWDERKAKVHPWCEGKLEENICEVCHQPFNPDEWKELSDKYKDEIYRPGEDISALDQLSEGQKSERRQEIEDIFANPEKYAEVTGE